MNILISGVNGFIGGDLFSHCNEIGGIVPYGISRTSEEKNIFRLDLSDRESVNKFIENIKSLKIPIDSFIHCAAILATSDSQNDVSLFQKNNTLTENVILIVNELSIKSLINLSTIGVYPNKDGEYYEESNINPSQNAECLYSLAKFCSEELFNFFLIPKKVFVTNLRLSQVYGKRMRQDRIYKIMEAELLADNKITVWGNGERVSNFVEINFVLKAILFFVSNNNNGLFNVGGENISYEQLAKKIIKENNKSSATISLVDKGVKSKVYINSEKLYRLLGIENLC